MSLAEYYHLRDDLVGYLAGDLVGPSAPEEEIAGAPVNRYIMGVLYPRKSGSLDPAMDDAPAEDDVETGYADPPVAFSNQQFPSSMGMTFAVDVRASAEIVVRARAARYECITEEADEEAVPADNIKRAGPTARWRRRPIPEVEIALPVATAAVGLRYPVAEGLSLYCRVRRVDPAGRAAVTVILMNTLVAGASAGDRDRKCVFQPELTVTATAGAGAAAGVFVERPTPGLVGNDEDLRAYRLLYRHAREFATGHGCAVAWDLLPGSFDRASAIRTTFTPVVPVALSDSREIASRAIGMRYLTIAPRAEIVAELHALCDTYADWIGARSAEVRGLAAELHETAHLHMDQCADALRRMRAGVAVLAADDTVWRAFTLMNRALLRQRARSVWIGGGKPTDAPVESDDHRWRPFQLAFILLCIEGIASPDSADRAIADLLWFPTGGGKTEAYLGLIAFTTFLRRLRNTDGGGVTALMRYTLRLLTIQQFERAALLICCCEELRHEEPDLGVEPISIGLWVGQGATPNKISDARTALNRLREHLTPDSGDPVQLHGCPWCGTPIDHTHYRIAPDASHIVIACRTPGCRYAKGLPVFVTDEEVYRFRPTLIIATVDKFAALPWRDSTADLFNLANGGRPTQRPPELIIQDELHLISGPLGTLVGLYETAIDLLCSRDGIGPKLIASTATIRRAAAQVHALFGRPVRQFPPSGLDARDSYFAVEARPEAKGDRAYLGLMAPGTSPATLLVRAYAALLQGVVTLPGDDAVKDPYWTLVGYFNSLRVLGGAVMQVRDDVGERIALLASNDRAKHVDGEAGIAARVIDYQIELTSREPSGKIPGHLKHMAVRLPAENTLDVILATNMISVGVDVDRLGLMVVMGQPQTTSEYIQATSRVGRRYPGLVVVLLHAARSRDRSHYESFAAYHSALYRQVEATGVTPFSARARDRGLHAVFVALARMTVPGLRPNAAAEGVLVRLADLEPVKAKILDRVRTVAPDEVDATARQLEDIVDRWVAKASVPDLEYECRKDPIRTLLIDAALGTESPEALPTLWSLRDVDAESRLRLID